MSKYRIYTNRDGKGPEPDGVWIKTEHVFDKYNAAYDYAVSLYLEKAINCEVRKEVSDVEA